jgi:UDP-N-acetylglucosamine 2-epimerase (non-hydrolysing)
VTAVVHVLATRPDAVTLAPVVSALARGSALEPHVLHTGQHSGTAMVDEMLADVGLGTPDRCLDTGAGSHAAQSARAMEAATHALEELRPAVVVVTGASNSAVGVAIAAAGLGVPVARLEAGLREHDWTVPEEVNRVLLDSTADTLFASSEEAVRNLRAERIGNGHVHLVGSTAVDSLRRSEDAARRRETWRRFGVARGHYALVTLHRPANVDDDEQLARIVEGLAQLARRVPVVFAIHPRTHERLMAMGDEERLRLAGVRCTPPLRYGDFLSLELGAGAVVTDSGTVQEETSALGVRCFTLRASTERTATLVHGTNTLLGDDPRELADVRLAAGDPERRELPHWDGRSGARVAALLVERYAERSVTTVEESSA